MESNRSLLKELGVNPEELTPEIVMSMEKLKQCVGEYKLMPDFTITIRLESNRLIQLKRFVERQFQTSVHLQQIIPKRLDILTRTAKVKS